MLQEKKKGHTILYYYYQLREICIENEFNMTSVKKRS